MINLLLSCDQSYFRYLYSTVLSAMVSANKETRYTFYVIDNGISEDSKSKLKKLVSDNGNDVNFLDFRNEIENLNLKSSFPLSAFGRLFVGRIPGIRRIIYLDCDMIVMDDLTELWNKELHEHVIGAVQDSVNRFFIDSIGISRNTRYINSGMLLIDVLRWNEYAIEERAIQYIEHMNGTVPHNDQGVINAVCEGKIEILDCRYNLQNPMICFNAKQIQKLAQIDNYYSEAQLEAGRKNPCIIHFTEEFYNRPWCENCTHPYKEQFDKIWSRTEWRGVYDKKKLSRNASIMQWVNQYLPFSCYCLMMRLITVKKKIQTKLHCSVLVRGDNE